MAKQTVNIGASVNDGSGDPARTAFNKLNLNNNEIYNYLGDGNNLNKLGTAAFKNTGTQVGNVMEVGMFGVGGINDLRGQDLSAPNKTYNRGFFTGLTNATQVGLGGIYASVAHFMPWVGFVVDAGPFMLMRQASRFYFRFGDDISWQNAEIKTTLNTTIDSNGFIKNASPIVQLFADKIELNDEAQQQSIEFEKLGVGDYLIKGSTGFSQDGWYIETPKDANGNALFSVIYETLENGGISVKTYKKKFDLETASIVADLAQPVDITTGRWIDLRLQEIEVTDGTEQ